MDTEEFLIFAEEIAALHPEDEKANRFLDLCSGSTINDREMFVLAGELVIRHAV